MTPTEVTVTKKKRILKSRERRPGSGADAASAVAVTGAAASAAVTGAAAATDGAE